MSDDELEEGQEFPPIGTYTGERNRVKERSGQGSAVLPNKDRFQGQYYRGKRYGKGKYTYANKLDEYEGDYVVNQKHGYGVFLYKDGTSYHGSWSNNKYHGHGLYMYINNDWFAGQWKHGVKDGKGFYYFAEAGIQLRGIWSNGDFVRGDWLFADGIYSGSFKNGQPIGQGTFRYTSGVVQHGRYVVKGKSRYWIVESFDTIDPTQVETAVSDKNHELREKHRQLYTSPLFSEARKEVVQEAFVRAKAQDDATEVDYLSVLGEVLASFTESFSVPESFFFEVIESLPLPPQEEKSVISFNAFWDATQTKEDVTESFKDIVFKKEFHDETIEAINALPKDEDGGVILNSVLNILVDQSASRGFDGEQIRILLSRVEPFVDLAADSNDAEPLNLQELWDALKVIGIERTRSVKVGVFEPEPEPEPEAENTNGAGKAPFELDAAQKEALGAAAQLDEDGNVPLLALRQLLSDLAAEWFPEEEVIAKFNEYVDSLPMFNSGADEEEKAATMVNFAHFMETFGGAVAGDANDETQQPTTEEGDDE